MDEVAVIERIFDISDQDKDGALSKLWREFAAHVTEPGGLCLQGLEQLYLDGFADAHQDYERLLELSISAREEVAAGGAQQRSKLGEQTPVAAAAAAAAIAAVQVEARGAAVTTKKQRLPQPSPTAAEPAGTGDFMLSTPASVRTQKAVAVTEATGGGASWATPAAAPVAGGAGSPMAGTPAAGTPVTGRAGMLSRTFTPCSDVFDGLITPKVYSAAAGFFAGAGGAAALGGEDSGHRGVDASAAGASGTNGTLLLASPETAGLFVGAAALASLPRFSLPAGPAHSPRPGSEAGSAAKPAASVSSGGSPGAVSLEGDVFDGLATPQRGNSGDLDDEPGSLAFVPPFSLPRIRTASPVKWPPMAPSEAVVAEGAGASMGGASWVESRSGAATPLSPDVFDGLATPPAAFAAAAGLGEATAQAAAAAADTQRGSGEASTADQQAAAAQLGSGHRRAASMVIGLSMAEPMQEVDTQEVDTQSVGSAAGSPQPTPGPSQPPSPVSDIFDGMLTPPRLPSPDQQQPAAFNNTPAAPAGISVAEATDGGRLAGGGNGEGQSPPRPAASVVPAGNGSWGAAEPGEPEAPMEVDGAEAEEESISLQWAGAGPVTDPPSVSKPGLPWAGSDTPASALRPSPNVLRSKGSSPAPLTAAGSMEATSIFVAPAAFQPTPLDLPALGSPAGSTAPTPTMPWRSPADTAAALATAAAAAEQHLAASLASYGVARENSVGATAHVSIVSEVEVMEDEATLTSTQLDGPAAASIAASPQQQQQQQLLLLTPAATASSPGLPASPAAPLSPPPESSASPPTSVGQPTFMPVAGLRLAEGALPGGSRCAGEGTATQPADAACQGTPMAAAAAESPAVSSVSRASLRAASMQAASLAGSVAALAPAAAATTPSSNGIQPKDVHSAAVSAVPASPSHLMASTTAAVASPAASPLVFPAAPVQSPGSKPQAAASRLASPASSQGPGINLGNPAPGATPTSRFSIAALHAVEASPQDSPTCLASVLTVGSQGQGTTPPVSVPQAAPLNPSAAVAGASLVKEGGKEASASLAAGPAMDVKAQDQESIAGPARQAPSGFWLDARALMEGSVTVDGSSSGGAGALTPGSVLSKPQHRSSSFSPGTVSPTAATPLPGLQPTIAPMAAGAAAAAASASTAASHASAVQCTPPVPSTQQQQQRYAELMGTPHQSPPYHASLAQKVEQGSHGSRGLEVDQAISCSAEAVAAAELALAGGSVAQHAQYSEEHFVVAQRAQRGRKGARLADASPLSPAEPAVTGDASPAVTQPTSIVALATGVAGSFARAPASPAGFPRMQATPAPLGTVSAPSPSPPAGPSSPAATSPTLAQAHPTLSPAAGGSSTSQQLLTHEQGSPACDSPGSIRPALTASAPHAVPVEGAAIQSSSAEVTGIPVPSTLTSPVPPPSSSCASAAPGPPAASATGLSVPASHATLLSLPIPTFTSTSSQEAARPQVAAAPQSSMLPAGSAAASPVTGAAARQPPCSHVPSAAPPVPLAVVAGAAAVVGGGVWASSLVSSGQREATAGAVASPQSDGLSHNDLMDLDCLARPSPLTGTEPAAIAAASVLSVSGGLAGGLAVSTSPDQQQLHVTSTGPTGRKEASSLPSPRWASPNARLRQLAGEEQQAVGAAGALPEGDDLACARHVEFQQLRQQQQGAGSEASGATALGTPASAPPADLAPAGASAVPNPLLANLLVPVAAAAGAAMAASFTPPGAAVPTPDGSQAWQQRGAVVVEEFVAAERAQHGPRRPAKLDSPLSEALPPLQAAPHELPMAAGTALGASPTTEAAAGAGAQASPAASSAAPSARLASPPLSSSRSLPSPGVAPASATHAFPTSPPASAASPIVSAGSMPGLPAPTGSPSLVGSQPAAQPSPAPAAAANLEGASVPNGSRGLQYSQASRDGAWLEEPSDTAAKRGQEFGLEDAALLAGSSQPAPNTSPTTSATQPFPEIAGTAQHSASTPSTGQRLAQHEAQSQHPSPACTPPAATASLPAPAAGADAMSPAVWYSPSVSFGTASQAALSKSTPAVGWSPAASVATSTAPTAWQSPQASLGMAGLASAGSTPAVAAAGSAAAIAALLASTAKARSLVTVGMIETASQVEATQLEGQTSPSPSGAAAVPLVASPGEPSPVGQQQARPLTPPPARQSLATSGPVPAEVIVAASPEAGHLTPEPAGTAAAAAAGGLPLLVAALGQVASSLPDPSAASAGMSRLQSVPADVPRNVDEAPGTSPGQEDVSMATTLPGPQLQQQQQEEEEPQASPAFALRPTVLAGVAVGVAATPAWVRGPAPLQLSTTEASSSPPWQAPPSAASPVDGPEQGALPASPFALPQEGSILENSTAVAAGPAPAPSPGSQSASAKKTNTIFRKFRTLLGRRNAGVSVTPLALPAAEPPVDASAAAEPGAGPAEAGGAAGGADAGTVVGLAGVASVEPAAAPAARAEAVATHPAAPWPDAAEVKATAVALPLAPPELGQQALGFSAAEQESRRSSSPGSLALGLLESPLAPFTGLAASPNAGEATSEGEPGSWAGSQADPAPSFSGRGPTISLVEQQLAAAMAGTSLMDEQEADLAAQPTHASHAPDLAAPQLEQQQEFGRATSPAEPVGSLPLGSRASSSKQVAVAAVTRPAGLPLQAHATEAAAPDSLEAHLAGLQLSGQLQSSSRNGSEALSPTLNLEARLEAVALEAGLPPSPAQFLRLEAAFSYTSIHTRASSASTEREVCAGAEEDEVDEDQLPSPDNPRVSGSPLGSPVLLWVPPQQRAGAAAAAGPTPAFVGFGAATASEQSSPDAASFSFGAALAGIRAAAAPGSVGAPTPGISFAPGATQLRTAQAPTPAFAFGPEVAGSAAATSPPAEAGPASGRSSVQLGDDMAAADSVACSPVDSFAVAGPATGPASVGAAAAVGMDSRSSSISSGAPPAWHGPGASPDLWPMPPGAAPTTAGAAAQRAAGVTPGPVSLPGFLTASQTAPSEGPPPYTESSAARCTSLARDSTSSHGSAEAVPNRLGSQTRRSLQSTSLAELAVLHAEPYHDSQGAPHAAPLPNPAAPYGDDAIEGASPTAMDSPTVLDSATTVGLHNRSSASVAAASPAGSMPREPPSPAGLLAAAPAEEVNACSPLGSAAAAWAGWGSEAAQASPLASGAARASLRMPSHGSQPGLDTSDGLPSTSRVAGAGSALAALPASFGDALPETTAQRGAWAQRPKEELEAHIAQLVSQLEVLLSAQPISTADIVGLQGEASQLPGWAAHRAHMELGMRLNQKQRHYEALRSFHAAVASEPEDPLAHFRMGNAYFALRKYPEARKAYLTALRCCQTGRDEALKPKICVNLGITEEAEGLLMAACDYYRQVTALNPAHFRAHKLLGSALYALGDFGGAAAALRQALKLKPDYADAYCDLGCTYCALGEVDKAKKCFALALQHNPQHLEAHFNRGNLYRQLAEFQRAISSYDAVLAVDPSHWRSLLNKAVVQTCTGEKEEAAFNLKLALKLSGQGSVLQQEIDQLKRMLKQGASWEVVSQMMSYISDKAAQVESSCADGAPTPQSKMAATLSSHLGNLTNKMKKSPLMGGSANGRGKTKLQRLGYNINEVVQQLDVPMLQQLGPLAGARVADLLAEAVDENAALGRKGKQIRVAKAEALLRRILATTPAGLFQHMMRTIHSQVLAQLDQDRSGFVDLAKLLTLLVALCDASSADRLQAAYKIMAWANQGSGVTQGNARDYAAALKVVFGVSHDPADFTTDRHNSDGQQVLLARFETIATDAQGGFPLFEILPLLLKPLA
ncbi:hypothetical protein N2152v2_003200 [Parachlorella kessleri]